MRHLLSATAVLSALACLAPAAHAADEPFSALLALQSHPSIQSVTEPDGTSVELIDLNPSVGRWALLKVSGLDGKARWAHLDLGQEGARKASLAKDGSLVVQGAGKPSVCRLDTPAAREVFAKTYAQPFTPVCGGALFVRSRPSKGYKSDMEAATDWLRDQGSLGEQLISWRKDLFPASGDSASEARGPAQAASASAGSPQAAKLDPSAPSRISTANLGLPIGSGSLAPGAWAPVQGAPGVWASVNAPSFAPAFSGSEAGSSALAYLMAIDLNANDARYSVGVDHPTVGWSTRAPAPRMGPGPDGFGSLEPLDRVGVVPPWALGQLQAVFAGGFKREHSGFKDGPLSKQNHGSHYGFAEAGVALSRLNAGLATFYQRVGEPARIKVWTEEDEKRGLDGVVFARQNGRPLISDGKPGANLAISYGANWSGAQDGSPQTMRSALCVAQNGSSRHAIYAVFTKALPKDMARMLLAYGCQDAMQLDMNAPALTYAAVASRAPDGKTRFMPLISSMNDRAFGGSSRFVAMPDSRDFFYFVRH